MGATLKNKMTISNRLWPLIPLILSSIPFLLIGFYIDAYGVNLPFWDEWSATFPVAVKTQQGNLTFADIFRQHSSHRFVFTKTLTALLTVVNGWNLKIMMYISFLMAGLNFVIVSDLFRQRFPKATPFVLIPFSALIFSYRQYGIWLWGLGTQVLFARTFFLSALWVLKRLQPGWKPLLVAALLAFCGTFSFGYGMLIWGILIIILWTGGYRQKRHYLFWVLATIVSIGLYFTDFHRLESTSFELKALPDLIHYVMIYLSGGFFQSLYQGEFFQPARVTYLGLILLALSAIYLWHRTKTWTAIDSWLTLVLFAVLVAGLTSLGRIQFGVNQALSSRYVAVSVLFWVAVVALALTTIWHVIHQPERQKWEVGMSISIAIILIGVTAIFFRGNREAGQFHGYVTDQHEACSISYARTRNLFCFSSIEATIHPDQELFQSDMGKLFENRLALFADVKTE